MATVSVGAGQLWAAYNAASVGDTLIVSGMQDMGAQGSINWDIHKRLTILNAVGQRATIKARIVIWEDANGTIIDGQTTDPRNAGFILNGNYGGNGKALLIRASSGKVTGFDQTTQFTCINVGIDAPSTAASHVPGQGFELSYGIIREAGPIGDNTAQGGYMEGQYGWLHDLLILDNAARGLQLRGCVGFLCEYLTIADNGEGVIFDSAQNNIVRKSIIAYSHVAGRHLIEQVDTLGTSSSGNTVDDNYIWDGSGVAYTDLFGGATVTNTQNVNPQFVSRVTFGSGGLADYSLASGSPAAGYGARFLSSGGSPPPTPAVTNTVKVRASSKVEPTALASSLVVPTPGGASPGDILYAAILQGDNGAATVTPPTGWTQVLTKDVGDTGGGGTVSRLLVYRLALAGPPAASYTWSFSASIKCCGAMAAVQTANTGILEVASRTDLSGTTNNPGVNVVIPGITGYATGLELFFAAQANQTAFTFSSATKAVEAITTAGGAVSLNRTVTIAYKATTADGASSSETVTDNDPAGAGAGNIEVFATGALTLAPATFEGFGVPI